MSARTVKVHFLRTVHHDTRKVLTACGIAGFQTDIPSEFHTEASGRFEATEQFKRVTCGRCAYSAAQDAARVALAKAGDR